MNNPRESSELTTQQKGPAMQNQLHPVAAAYVRSVNESDQETFATLFALDANVEDAGRQISGVDAISEWSKREIFQARVTLDVFTVTNRASEIIVTAKVDGNFDRSGLPDPLLIDHYFTVKGGVITEMKCRLASAQLAT